MLFRLRAWLIVRTIEILAILILLLPGLPAKAADRWFNPDIVDYGEKLSNEEVLAVIAYFQSKWPDEVYEIWHQHFMQ